jgi:hypothetical protein
MKKIFIVFTLTLLLNSLFAQNDSVKVSGKPVRFTFATTTLVDNQTTESIYKGGIEFQIHHRFSLIEDISDLFGIYGSANTRLALSYGITDRLMVGFGTSKDYKLQDFHWKYVILQQTEDNRIPVSLAYYGNMVIDARAEENFGPEESFKPIHRLSYFTQLIVARKLSERFSIQVAPSFAYFNSVPLNADSTEGYKNLNYGISAGAKANLFGSNSLILEYDQMLAKQDTPEQPKPNLALGWEVGTATHSFQIFVSNFNKIINQYDLLYNTNDFKEWEYLVGFNIHVRF